MTRMDTRALMQLFGNPEESTKGGFILMDDPDPDGGFGADRDSEDYADEM